jgi:HK97 family phage portal protein
MTWYNPSTWFPAEEKANPAQEIISLENGLNIGSDALLTYKTAFDKLETVGRGTNLIVSACSSLDYDIKDKVHEGVVSGVRVKSLHTLLNFRPNPYQSTQDFRTNIFTDFILEGNIFIYYDGAFLYHLPASSVQIITDPKVHIARYKYNNTVSFTADEVIHIKDISSSSIYRGTSRLASAERSIKTLYKMQNFQDQFFENGAVAGMIITTDNTLSQVVKDKTILNWQQKWSPKNGARRPMILDSGLKPSPFAAPSFQEMDFDTSIKTHDTKILKALGVPPLLLDGGNNANISPNLRLFYLETVMPINTRFVSAIERYFGYDVSPVTSNVSALQPELKDVAAYHTTLVNGGVLTPNEARIELRYEKVPEADADKLRVPANIAGSAANPAVGGAPKKPPKTE